jgi:hypothetical protein
MPCGFFEDGRLCRCAAVRGLLVPSHHERERFCLSDEPSRCPTFRARALRDGPLPEEVYYALWLPLADERDPDCQAAGAELRALLVRVPDPPRGDARVCQGFTAG